MNIETFQYRKKRELIIDYIDFYIPMKKIASSIFPIPTQMHDI